MAQWEHSGGFSVDASVRIEPAHRAGRERLLRYCARPPFALDRLRELDPERLLYESTKPDLGGNGPLLLPPLELLDRLAALCRRRPGCKWTALHGAGRPYCQPSYDR
jgi:Putative transposase